MKAVIITGASSGIGKDTALVLAKAGYQVFAGVRKKKDFEGWTGQPNVTPVVLDVAREEDCLRAVADHGKVLSAAKAVHLVNNAGIALGGPVEGLPLEKWKEQFEVNVFGLLRSTQAFLPFVRATRGRVVNISSVSGLATSPYLGPYSASKFAVESISDALRREMRQFGVEVIVVEPGPVATPIWEKSLGRKEEVLGLINEEMRKLYGREMEVFFREVDKAGKSGIPVRMVSSTVEKALSAKKPRTRYMLGPPGTGISMGLVGALPDRWVDAIMSRGMK